MPTANWRLLEQHWFCLLAMDRSEKPCPICVSIVDHRICGVCVEKESGGGIEINKRQAESGNEGVGQTEKMRERSRLKDQKKD